MFKTRCAKFLLLSALPVLLGHCANRAAPSGGPEDKTPPAVASVFPSPDSLFVAPDTKIEFTFSEWVRTDNIEKAVFVSPTRPLMKVKAHGRKLRLVPQGPLLDSTTYVIVLGSEIQDMRGNKLAESYSLSFSTGAFLDTGRIGGRVSDEAGRPLPAGTSLFAYLKKDTGQINPVKDIPDYITQSGSDGAFVLKNLKFGAYRLFAVGDYNRNRRFNPDREIIGIPSVDVALSPGKPRQAGLVFVPVRQDTLPLFIEKATLSSGGQLLLTFNKAVADSLRLSPSHYTITLLDSSLSKSETTAISAIHPLPGDSLSLLCLIPPTKARKKYRCRAYGLFAMDGALPDTSRLYIDFPGNPGADSVAPKLVLYSPPKYALDVAETDSLLFQFSEPVREKELGEGFSLSRLVITRTKTDSLTRSDTVRSSVAGHGYCPTPLRFVFRPDSLFGFGGEYRWRITPEKLVDESGNFSTDTLMAGGFTVIAEGEYGSISGRLLDSLPSLYRIQLLAKTGKKMVETSPDKNGYYLLERIPEGDYRITAYQDLNGNHRRDPGRLRPFVFSEKNLSVSDSVHVRKRWDVEHLDVPGAGE